MIITVDTAEEHKCMVRLMKMALGFTEKTAEVLLSPTKNGSSTPEKQIVEEEEIVYEDEEYLIEELIE